jgi:hypothetical protein
VIRGFAFDSAHDEIATVTVIGPDGVERGLRVTGA